MQGESYFTNNGTSIPNNSVVKITENDYYTFYAEDKVGNKQEYTLNITVPGNTKWIGYYYYGHPSLVPRIY